MIRKTLRIETNQKRDSFVILMSFSFSQLLSLFSAHNYLQAQNFSFQLNSRKLNQDLRAQLLGLPKNGNGYGDTRLPFAYFPPPFVHTRS